MTIIQEKNDVRMRVRKRRRRNKQLNLVKNPRRVMIVISICLLMVFGGYFGVRGEFTLNNGAYAAEETVYKTVTVYKGDTIWGIASQYSEPSKDVRKLVREICEINNVEPGKIYAGQILLVPVPAHLV